MLIDSRDIKTLAVAGVVLIVFGVGLWLPAELERRDLRERIGQAERALQGELADVQLLDPLRDQVAQLHVAVDEAPHYVPPREDLDHLLRRLTEAMEDFDLQQQEIVTERSQFHGDHGVSSVAMRFEGGFPATYGVLQQIESLPRLVRIDRATFEPASADIGGPLRVSVELSTFFTGNQEAR